MPHSSSTLANGSTTISSSPRQQLAFLGLGAMGFGMATNLLTAHSTHYTVTGFDIWGPTLKRFAAEGGSTATTPRDCVKGAKNVVLMVATAKQVDDALFGVTDGVGAAWEVLEQGATLVLCSTGPPGYTLDVERKLAERGRSDVLIIDAPVSGGTARAANGTLTILASGTEVALERGRAVLDAMSGGLSSEGKGGNLWIIEGGLGKGTEVKMVHQVLAAVGVLMTSEVLGLVARMGLNTKSAFDEINKSEAWNWMFENRGAHLFETEDKIYSALNIMVKDIGIVTSGSRLNSLPMFLSSTTEQVLFSSAAAGNGLLDDSKLIRVYSPEQPNIVLESSTVVMANDEAKLELVKSLMKAINLAVSAEAMSLGKRVGLSTQQLYEIIKGAAGGSWVFQNRVPELISGSWQQVQNGKTVSEVVRDLEQVIEVAHDLRYPLHLGATTLQLFQLAQFRGWGAENELVVSKIWEA